MRGEEFQVFGNDDYPSRKEFGGPELNAFKISSESKILGLYDHLTRTTYSLPLSCSLLNWFQSDASSLQPVDPASTSVAQKSFFCREANEQSGFLASPLGFRNGTAGKQFVFMVFGLRKEKTKIVKILH